MFTRFLVALAAVSLAVSAYTQERTGLSKPKPHTQKVAKKADVPVTEAEAVKVLAKAEKILVSVASTRAGTLAIKPSTKPVTRQAVVREFGRIFRALKPTFKVTPKMVVVKSRGVSITGPERKDLDTLVLWGAVGPYAPLATSKSKNLTVSEFGDAVGFFMARMADLTHLPSSKYTPALMKND